MILPGTHPASILKYCPACGAESFKFSGSKYFTCGTCGFIYYVNPAPAVVAVIESSDGRIVLTRRKFEPRMGYLDLPGGFVDMLESAEEALKREIMEELGISVNSMEFIGTCPNEYVFKGLSYYTCDMGFVCGTDELSDIRPADDVSEALLVRPDEINFSEIGFPSIEKLLRIYMARKK